MNLPATFLAVLAASAFIAAVYLMLIAAFGAALVCGLIAGCVGWAWRRDWKGSGW